MQYPDCRQQYNYNNQIENSPGVIAPDAIGNQRHHCAQNHQRYQGNNFLYHAVLITADYLPYSCQNDNNQ